MPSLRVCPSLAPSRIPAVTLVVAAMLASCSGKGGSGTTDPDGFIYSPTIEPFATDSAVLVTPQAADEIVLPDGRTATAARRQLLLHFLEDATQAQVNAAVAAVEAAGARVVGQLPETRMLQAETASNDSLTELVASLREAPGVLDASLNEAFELAIDPDPDVSAGPGGYWIDAIHAREAWDVSTGAAAVKLGVVDSGIDLAAGHHPAGQVQIVNVFGGLTVDEVGHGTSVASLVGAPGDDGVLSVGMAWRNPICVADVQLSIGGVSETLFSLNIEQAIVRTIDAGARIVNVSLGAKIADDEDPIVALQQFRLRMTPTMQYARKMGALVVWAAGNDAIVGDDQLLPADTPARAVLEGFWREYGMIVAATDAAGSLTSFTNRGRVVDLAAPGANVLVGAATGFSTAPVPSGLALASGTSFSAPIVTGVAGLVASVNPELTASQIKAIVKATCSRPSAFPAAEGGDGIVNALEAVCAAQGSLAVEVAPLVGVTLAEGGSQQVPLGLQTSAGLLVNQVDMMFLIDRTGSYGDDINTLQTSASALINDLTTLVPDIRFGVSGFADYPIEPFGSAGDSAFQLLQSLTCEPTLALQGIDLLDQPLLNGNDFPESQYEGIVQALTGRGIDLDGDGAFSSDGDVAPSAAGWREGALPVLVFSTDADFHDPATTAGYPGSGASAALSELAASGTVIIGLGSGLTSEGLAQMQQLVAATSGQYYPLDSASTGLSTAILDGLSATLGAATLRVVTRGDAEGFADAAGVPPASGVGPNQSIGFTLPLNGVIPAGFFTQRYRFVAEIRAYDSATLKVFPIEVTVPGVVPF